MNIVGEPDEGKLHVRIDEGRLARQSSWTSRLLYNGFQTTHRAVHGLVGVRSMGVERGTGPGAGHEQAR